jgi:hypothetical protein
MVGNVPIGSNHPVAKQTMCTTNTRDVESSVNQVIPQYSFYYYFNSILQFYAKILNANYSFPSR